jgi:hypothetical protein
MADGVHHTRIREDLNLNREDLGLNPEKYTADQIEDIWQEITRSVRERDRELLLCIARANGEPCKAEHSGVKSPHMSVRKQRCPDGTLRWIAAHLPTPHDMTPEESDKHKATKEFIFRTCDKAGLDCATEKATKTRTARPDNTVFGKGGPDLGIEAQFYNASADTVRRRSRNHAEAGLVANWITDNDTFHLIDRANWMLMRPLPWREISAAADLPLMGGFRVLVEWRCTAAAERPCPNGKVKTGCDRTHLTWDTPRRLDGEATGYEGDRLGVTIGQTIVGAATGEVESLFIPSRKDRRSGAYLWVPSADKAKWMDHEGAEDVPDLDEPDPEDEVSYSHEEISGSCTYGEKTFDPTMVKSAPLKTRGLASLSITIDDPAPAETAAVDSQPKAADPAHCPGCGRPATHRTLHGVQRHYPGCSATGPERAA